MPPVRDRYLFDEEPLSEEEHKARMRPTPDWPVDKDGYPLPCMYCVGFPPVARCSALNGEGPCAPPGPSAPIPDRVST
mgnify:CR=1 FL=1